MKKRKISRENVDDELEHSYDITLEYDDFDDDEAKKEPENKPKRRYRRKGEDEEGEIEGKEILETQIIFCEKTVAVKFFNFHSVFLSPKFRETNSLVTHSVYKNVAFTKFLSKKCESKFPKFPQILREINF